MVKLKTNEAHRDAAEDVGAEVQIVTREDYSDVTFVLEVRHPMMARAARPGQFVIVLTHEDGERIPLTIADADHLLRLADVARHAHGADDAEKRRARLAVALHLLGGLADRLNDQGHGATVAVEVGDGLGVAPVYPQARAFKHSGAYVIGVVGFRTKELVFWEKKFRKVCDEFIICSDDGSVGIQGLVTDGVAQAIARHDDIDEVVAIGPPIMMKACAEATRPHGIKTTVSLNPVMVDGTGMCGGCRVKIGDGIKFACVDGPDFDGHLVDYDDLMMRLKRFAEDERLAMERWSADCRMEDPKTG